MTLTVHPLDPDADRAAVLDLFRRSADYVRLERGEEPSPALAAEFFTDAVPGQTADTTVKPGLCDASGPGHLLGISRMGFGYPEPGDAFLGLLQIDEAEGGKGLGRLLQAHAETLARARGARRLYVAVLDANPRGRAFWEREEFIVALANRPARLGSKDPVATRMVKSLV